ncbi:MAG TPA: long-chain-fatty-acid--CoA ligase [bacterium]|nr:long-chain-fatty-acid--CoA ligase [bacterium]
MELPLTPLELARRARTLYAEREAVVDGSRRLTYEEFFRRCDRWSNRLQQFGVRPGDRVAYIAPNVSGLLEAFYAVPQIGAVVVPINYRLAPDDFEYIINHSGATVVCAAAEHVAAVDGIRPRLENVRQFVGLDGAADGWLDYDGLVAQSDPVFERPAIAEGDLITINYTSGTTARPKGVMMTHRTTYMNVMGTLAHVHMTPAERYLWTLPMFHCNGWTFVWIVTAVGGTHLCLRRVEPDQVFGLCRDERATMMCAAPTVLIRLANAPEHLRRDIPRGIRVLTAGAPPAAATIGRIEGDFGWEIIHVYGLTETSPFITICEPRPEHAALSPEARAAVKARQGVELFSSGELRVVDSAGQEVPRDGGAVGEIVVRGNVVMKGYYNDPDATARAFAGGWFHTGDAAVVHPDGYVEIRDRIKDIIISGGENISSVEVEAALLRHPAVQEAAVVGLSDPQWGEATHAFVVLKAGQTASEADLREFARGALAHFKVPKAFHFVEDLPRTATGKIQKYVLRGAQAAIARQ